MSAGGTVIWLHRSAPEHELASPRALGSSCAGLSVQLDDVDAHHARARAKGARIDSEPQDMPTACASTAPAIPRATAGGSRAL